MMRYDEKFCAEIAAIPGKVDAILFEEEQIMSRCRVYGYDDPNSMARHSQEVKDQREIDLTRMQFLLAEISVIAWRLESLKSSQEV